MQKLQISEVDLLTQCVRVHSSGIALVFAVSERSKLSGSATTRKAKAGGNGGHLIELKSTQGKLRKRHAICLQSLILYEKIACCTAVLASRKLMVNLSQRRKSPTWTNLAAAANSKDMVAE